MILAKMQDQILVTPALGFIRNDKIIYFSLAWLWFVLNIRLFDYGE